jgi:hypothetical protein
MSIFDKFKEKASELVQSAGDKVSEATGVDLSGVTDKVTESTEGLTGAAQEGAQGLGETAQGLGETAQGHAENAQGFADSAGDQVTEVTGVDVPTEGLTDQATQQANDRLGDITGR